MGLSSRDGLGGPHTSLSAVPFPKMATLNILYFSPFLISLIGILEAAGMQAFILKTPTTFLLMTAVTPTFSLHDDSHSYMKGNKKAVIQRMGWVAPSCVSQSEMLEEAPAPQIHVPWDT